MSKFYVQVEFSDLVSSAVQEAIRLAFDKFAYEQDEKPVGLLIHPVALELLKLGCPDQVMEGPSTLPRYRGMVILSRLEYPLESVYVVDQANLDSLLVTP